MSWHGYILVNTLELSNSQKNSIKAAMRLLGPQNTGPAQHRNQYRERLDGSAAIIEALFDDGDLEPENLRPLFAGIIPGNPNAVKHRTEQTEHGELNIYSRNSIDYIELTTLGTIGATWDVSRQAANDYIAAYVAEWEPLE